MPFAVLQEDGMLRVITLITLSEVRSMNWFHFLPIFILSACSTSSASLGQPSRVDYCNEDILVKFKNVESIKEFEEPSIYGVFELRNVGRRQSSFWIEDDSGRQRAVSHPQIVTIFEQVSGSWEDTGTSLVSYDTPSHTMTVKPGRQDVIYISLDDKYYSMSPGESLLLKVQLEDEAACRYTSSAFVVDRSDQ